MAEAAKHTLGKWTFDEGFVSAVMRGRGGNFMAAGSENAMVTGDGYVRAFRGTIFQNGFTGSRVFFTTDDSYAGLGTAAVNGLGSVFKVRDLLFFIGAGQVNYAGQPIAGVTATPQLSLIRKVAGIYQLANEYQAGQAQPSAPIIYPKDVPSPGVVAMSSVVTLVIWRVSDITGQVSLYSLPSNELTLSAQSLIAQIPLADFNGQSHWGIGVPKVGFGDLGVYYELPTSAGGEVAEATLAYTRAVTGASIADTTKIVDITDPDVADQFTSADVGRRLAFGTFDSWIVQVNSPTQVEVFDVNDSGGAIAGDAVVTHAIEGITRAIEIGWSNGMLATANLAPDKAFPPVPGQFAGGMNDVLFLDADGIIYVSEPNQTGSFPPKNAIYASGPAVLYLEGPEGVRLRFGRNTIGALYYVGGSPALEYYEFRKHQGIRYAQNAGLGFNGRVCAWLGRPCVISDLEFKGDVDFQYAAKVMPEFDGWTEAQTALKPIVFAYDGLGQYECWCFGKMVMAKYAPTGAWCAPIDLTDLVTGDIVGSVTVDNVLYLSCLNGAGALRLYKYDAGAGTVMVIQSDDIPSRGSCDTITQVNVQGRADNLANAVIVQVVVNFDDLNPEPDPLQSYDSLPTKIGTQTFNTRRPNIMDAQVHAVRITMTSFGGHAGVDRVETMGSTSDIVI